MTTTGAAVHVANPCGPLPIGISGCGCAPWYVVQATPGAAHKVFNQLSERFRCHYPQLVVHKPVSRRGWPVYVRGKRATREVIEALFPGYLFVTFRRTDPWGVILRTEGVLKLFSRFHNDAWIPTQLPEGWVEALQARGRAGDGVIDDRKPAFGPLAKGAQGMILDGPFASFSAVFQMRSGADRIKVLATIFGRTTEVEIERDAFRVA